MRLIDADDLKKTYYRELNIEPGETGACYIAFGMFPRMIDNARTINIEKPKCGRWIKASTDGAVFCSECGTEWLSESAKYYKFCPICGARMEGEDE